MSIPPTPAGGPILEVKDLVVTYGGVVEALRGVSLSVAEGAVVALLGSNGAGKTTLLRTLSGTLRLHKGRVERGEVVYRGSNLKGRDPAACVASARAATFLMRSMDPTEVPPNFWTMRVTSAAFASRKSWTGQPRG